MNLRQLQRLLALLFAFALIAAACGGSDDGDDGNAETDTTEGGDTEETTATTAADTETEAVEGERTYGGDLVVGLEAEAVGLRPWEDTCASPCYNIMRSDLRPTLRGRRERNSQPFLAESVTGNDDFTEYVVTLRPGCHVPQRCRAHSPDHR